MCTVTFGELEVEAVMNGPVVLVENKRPLGLDVTWPPSILDIDSLLSGVNIIRV